MAAGGRHDRVRGMPGMQIARRGKIGSACCHGQMQGPEPLLWAGSMAYLVGPQETARTRLEQDSMDRRHGHLAARSTLFIDRHPVLSLSLLIQLCALNLDTISPPSLQLIIIFDQVQLRRSSLTPPVRNSHQSLTLLIGSQPPGSGHQRRNSTLVHHSRMSFFSGDTAIEVCFSMLRCAKNVLTVSGWIGKNKR